MTTDTPINVTAELLDMVGGVFDRYIAFPTPEHRTAVVLWTAHAHVASSFAATPRLAFLSAEPGSGKSTALELAGEMVPNPVSAINLKPATLWRLIDLADPHPTMLLDEVDCIFGRKGSGSAHVELRSIINAGHRKGAKVPRCVGAADVKLFDTFAPVAMAGLGHLPETIMSRAIVIRMKRAAPGHGLKPFRMKYAGPELAAIRSRLAAWGAAFGKQLEISCPQMPVSNRQADNWEPLFAIAELAGTDWLARCDRACRALTAAEGKAAPSAGQALLRDIKEVFAERHARQLFTSDLLHALYSRTDGQVAWKPDSFTAQNMARVLKEFDVQPVQIREGEKTGRGYRVADLLDPWSRYIPEVVA